MFEEKVSCSKCNKPIMYIARYCCDPMKSFCVDCSLIPCRICGTKRNNVHRSEDRLRSRIRCVVCHQPQDKPKQYYYIEKKCKQYYCFSCLLIFYRDYCGMIEELEKQYGSSVEMQVQLKCGCEVERKVLIDYLRNYCVICAKKNEGVKCIQLRNKCKVMEICLEKIKRDVESTHLPLQLRAKHRKIFLIVLKDIVECENCKLIIDGQRIKMAEEVDGISICVKCLNIAKRAEERYSKQPLENLKIKQKQEQSVEKKDEKNILDIQCQVCSVIIKKMINGSKICKLCFDNLDKAGNSEDIEEHPKQSKIKDVSMVKIDKNPPLKEEKQEKILFKRVQNLSQKERQSKKQKPQGILKLENIEENIIPPSEDESLPAPSEGSRQIPENDEFYKPNSFKLIISPMKTQVRQCIECGGRIEKDSCFDAYQQEPGNQRTLRIAETQKEIMKFSQELKVYCKICYMDVKMREQRQLKQARQEQQRRKQVVRGYSQPKKIEEKVYYSPLQASKYQRQEKLQKRYNMLGTAPESFASPKIQKPILAQKDDLLKVICLKCKRLVHEKQYSGSRKQCRDCETQELENELKQKKKEEITKLKCEMCNRHYVVGVNEVGKLKRCTNCTAKLFTR